MRKMDLHHSPFASSQTQEVMGKTDSAMMLARNTNIKREGEEDPEIHFEGMILREDLHHKKSFFTCLILS